MNDDQQIVAWMLFGLLGFIVWGTYKDTIKSILFAGSAASPTHKTSEVPVWDQAGNPFYGIRTIPVKVSAAMTNEPPNTAQASRMGAVSSGPWYWPFG